MNVGTIQELIQTTAKRASARPKHSRTMKTYDLYGYKTDENLELAHSMVENAIGLKLQAHESSYHCGDYYRYSDSGHEHFILQRNYDKFENEWSEPDYPSCLLLLYVNETSRALVLEQKLTSGGTFDLLRREEL